MGSQVECFWLEPGDTARRFLRRYDPDSPCPENRMRFCDHSNMIDDIPYPLDTGKDRYGFMLFGEDMDHQRDDPRWPSVCPSCSKPFRVEAKWQCHAHRLFTGAPDGKLYTTRDMPPGAMYDALWWKEHQKGPDGICLVVVLPPNGGDDWWMVDGPANNGGGWTRTGTVPKVTARPSILTSRYHGFLTDGVLVEC